VVTVAATITTGQRWWRLWWKRSCDQWRYRAGGGDGSSGGRTGSGA